MKYIDEFRDTELTRALLENISRTVNETSRYRLMEFCGGHTHAIHRYGLPALLPSAIELVHGPGCPVCVLPVGRIDAVRRLAAENNVTVCTYSDLMRVPASGGESLFGARARGADIRMVYSPLQALELARVSPDREVVFVAIGFETTTPPTAALIQKAAREGIDNFSVYCSHVLTPAAITALMSQPESRAGIDGIIGPAHVSTVIGSDAYGKLADRYRTPIVIAGFEPLDILQAILMLIRQVNEGRAEVENEYSRFVTPFGNLKACEIVNAVFELRPESAWRGLGRIPESGLRIREQFARYDAEQRYNLEERFVPEPAGCACGKILQGLMKPPDCALFARGCTPESPVGACMVSSEGACAAWFTYRRTSRPRHSAEAPKT